MPGDAGREEPRGRTPAPQMTGLDPEELLVGLDQHQAAAVRITRGPLVIHAGAGSGKTRVIAHRVAYAVATRAADPRRVLVVTFTDKAAGEMAERLAALGLPGVAARTFHAAALAQLRHFWPARHDGDAAPAVLDSKIPIVGRLARGLPGGYRFTTAKDLADEIEWAKSRRLRPATYGAESGSRTPPIPAELFVRLWAAYEQEKDRAGRLDFDDMLTRTVDLLESDETAAATVRARYAWFSVDEYQDTNPLQQRLLELWLGDRDDVCVVGDEDQTIYTFAGATSAFLTGFAGRFPGAREVTLDRNYRSSPQVLALANRLLASEGRRKRLVATRPAGPTPDDPALRGRRRGARADHGDDPPAHRRRHAARRDRGPRPAQRPGPADRGRPDPGGDRVPRPRAALLRTARGAAGAPAPAAAAGGRARRWARRCARGAASVGPRLRPGR